MTKRSGWSCVSTIVLGACTAVHTPSPTASDATPPWLLRHVFEGWDGKPVEVLGAPGPRAIAAFLVLAKERSMPQSEALARASQIPDFYEIDFAERWRVRSTVLFESVSWEGLDDEVLAGRRSDPLLDRLSLPELAFAVGDIVWKWPERPGQTWFGWHPVERPDVVGPWYGSLLRKKLERGQSLQRAWSELQFQLGTDTYVTTLLDTGRLRVVLRDRPDVEAWEGVY